MWMEVGKHTDPELRVALLGGAAQTIWSVFGQGCRCSLQGASVLSQKVTEDETRSMAEAFAEFSKESKREEHEASDSNFN